MAAREKTDEQVERVQWREDFPIQWENDHYVTRRELAKFLTLGSALLTGANVFIAVLAKLTPAPGNFPHLKIAGADAVPAGGSMLFRYPTDANPCILVRATDGTYRAFSQVCSHLSCAVIHRASEQDLFCPCHHGVFETTEGRPTAGPPERPLHRIDLVQQGNDLYAVAVKL